MAPVTLRPKILLQNLCRAGVTWDEKLTSKQATEWQTWLHSLTDLNDIQLSRCFETPDFGTVSLIELHHFADSSSDAYGACSYLRLTDDRGNINKIVVF